MATSAVTEQVSQTPLILPAYGFIFNLVYGRQSCIIATQFLTPLHCCSIRRSVPSRSSRASSLARRSWYGRSPWRQSAVVCLSALSALAHLLVHILVRIADWQEEVR